MSSVRPCREGGNTTVRVGYHDCIVLAASRDVFVSEDDFTTGWFDSLSDGICV